MPHPPGTIGVLSGSLSRWSWFAQSLLQMQMPAGTQVVWCEGSWISVAVNKLVQAMRPEDQWLQVMADDHIWTPDLLMRLLDHNLPVVTPLCALRQFPYAPSLFHDDTEGFRSYTWGELHGKTGLLPVDSTGGALAVIRREVLETLGQPFYQNMPGALEAPQEDLYTYRRIRQAGFQPYVDLDCQIGHCLAAAVWPGQHESGAYGVRLWSYRDLGMIFPEQAITSEDRYHAYT
jgi:GT2 family glycosyltransferase